ncbi:MAG: D-alanyl-D-alanine carboxypeptidase [bacterium]|nr:D-alanyl-D-alanine carboxypeptidase [bacterium]
MKKISLIIAFLSFFANMSVNSAVGPDIKAPYAILMDFDSGKILFERNSTVPVPPSSMSKLMTIYYIFEKIKNGTYTLDTEFVVGPEAWKKAKAMNANSGSTMFLEYGEKVRIEDLIRGIIVNSGNDATIVIAENVSGSEAKFVDELNELAYRLGLKKTTLVNASGWYEKDHLMSVEDLAVLSRRIIQDFPEYYHYFGEKEFLYKEKLTGNKDNRNKLLWIMPSSDGLKTGHTTKGGYGLSSSAKKNDRRLISVVNGIKGGNPSYIRFTDSKALLEWGFREFSNLIYFEPNDKVIEIPVWFGKKSKVSVGVSDKVLVTNKIGENPNVELRATYNSPLPAPVVKGTEVGKLTLYIDGNKIRDYKLITLENVERSNFLVRIFKNIKQIILNIVS